MGVSWWVKKLFDKIHYARQQAACLLIIFPFLGCQED
jgi:hypothetical protein